MASEIKYAPIYFDAKAKLAKLSDEERGKLLLAILDYAEASSKGEAFELTEDYGLSLASELSFDFMTDGIDRCYEVSKQRSESGAKGGSKLKQAEANSSKLKQTEANESKTKQNGEDKDKDKDKEKDKDKDYDKDKDKDYDESITANAVCAEPSKGSALVISIPLNDGTEYAVFEDEVQTWKSLYPAVDIMQELRKMAGWSMSHPQQRKTKRGIQRFINSWLAKEQDRGNRASPGKRSWIEVGDDMERRLANDDI